MSAANPITPARMPRRSNAQKITEEVIAFAEFALARRFTKAQAKRLLKEQFQISARSCETVISRARKQLLGRIGKTPQELREEAYLLFDSVVRDGAATVRERLLAQESIVELFGLKGPIKVDLTRAGETNDAVRELMKSPEGAAALEQVDDMLASRRRKD